MGELWAHLPRESRTVRLACPDAEWGDGEWLLRSLEYDVRALHWALTYDKRRPTPKPKPLDSPGAIADARRRRDAALAARDEIDAAFGL